MRLDLNELETAVLKRALDTFIRTRMGRADSAMDSVTYAGVRYDGRKLTVEETHEANDLLLKVSEILTGIRHGGPSIGNPIVSNDARVALRLIARVDGDTFREGMYHPDGSPPL